MSILSSNTLDDCLYIPDFIAAGTRMIFENASAPVSWTKDTVPSTTGIALRVVTGTITPRTGTPFSQVLTTRPQSATIPQVIATANTSQNSANLTITANQIRGPFATSSVVDAIHAHGHGGYQHNALVVNRSSPGPQSVSSSIANTPNTDARGGSAQHAHTVSVSPHQHATNTTHGHTIGGVQHSHNVSSSENFSVFYRDMIICVKD